MIVDKNTRCPFCQTPLRFYDHGDAFDCLNQHSHREGRVWGWLANNAVDAFSMTIGNYSLTWHMVGKYNTLWDNHTNLIYRTERLLPLDPNNIDIKYWREKMKTLALFS